MATAPRDGSVGIFGAIGGVLSDPLQRPMRDAIRYRGRGDISPRGAITTATSHMRSSIPDMPGGGGRGGIRKFGVREDGRLRSGVRVPKALVDIMAGAADAAEVAIQHALYLKRQRNEFNAAAAISKIEKTEEAFENFLVEAVDRETVRPDALKFVRDFAGDFTKKRNEKTALFIPFGRWYSSMLRMTLYTLPVKHPGRTLVLNLLGEQAQREAEEEGTTIWQGATEAMPIFGKRFLNLSNIEPAATVPSLALSPSPLAIGSAIGTPFITRPVQALAGIDFRSGLPLENEKGEVIGAAGESGMLGPSQPRSGNPWGDSLLNLAGEGARLVMPWNQFASPRSGQAATSNPSRA